MQTIIAKMRADWPVVEADRRACGDWTDEDVAEIGAAVKEAIGGKDANLIVLWARWLADLSALSLGLKVSGVTKKIRAQVKKQKEEAKA